MTNSLGLASDILTAARAPCHRPAATRDDPARLDVGSDFHIPERRPSTAGHRHTDDPPVKNAPSRPLAIALAAVTALGPAQRATPPDPSRSPQSLRPRDSAPRSSTSRIRRSRLRRQRPSEALGSSARCSSSAAPPLSAALWCAASVPTLKPPSPGCRVAPPPTQPGPSRRSSSRMGRAP